MEKTKIIANKKMNLKKNKLKILRRANHTLKDGVSHSSRQIFSHFLKFSFHPHFKKWGVRRNKKGQMLNQEIVLIVVALILIGLVLFFSFKYVKSSRKDFEYSPEIGYQYPSVYVHSFLNKKVEINKENVDETGLSEGTYLIKELFLMIDNEKIEDIIKSQKKEYIKQDLVASSLKKYKTFSKDDFDEDFLLMYEKDKTEIPDLGKQIENKNYFFYLKDKNNKFIIIYFKKPTTLSDQVLETGYCGVEGC